MYLQLPIITTDHHIHMLLAKLQLCVKKVWEKSGAKRTKFANFGGYRRQSSFTQTSLLNVNETHIKKRK